MIYTKSKKTLTLILGLFVLSTLTACTIDSQTSEIKTIKIWVIAPMSWPWASYWEDAVNLYKYTIDNFNNNQKKVKIDLIIEDWKCSWKDATSAAQKLITIDQVDLILWWMCSSETLAAGKLAQDNKTLLLSAISSAPEISYMWDYIFRFYSDNQTAEVLANNLRPEIKTIALLTENTDYAIALNKKFKEVYPWEIIVEEKFNSDEKDFDLMINKLIWKDFEALVLINQSESTAISILKSLDNKWLLESLRWKIYGQFLCSSQAFLDWAWDLAEDMICTDVPLLETLDQKSTDYINEFKKIHTINAFDSRIAYQQEAADMVFEAILDWNYDSTSIRDYLVKIDKNHPRKWYLWEVYFDENWDIVWLNAIMERVVNWKVQIIK